MALIPPFFLNCVVAIGVMSDNQSMSWIGTGFLYGRFLEINDEGINNYNVFLISNKHVLEAQKRIFVKFNPLADEPSKDFDIELIDNDGNKLWYGHPDPDIDVGAIRIIPGFLREQQIDFNFFQSDLHIATIRDMKNAQVSEGDSIFVLGFPMGIVSSQRQHVICRKGCISRVRDALEGRSKEFLIDASVFPGNSGGPVINSPDMNCINGTKAIQKSDLIGIVKSYISFQDIAISQQTKRPRIIFEENSGLASVVPVDFIMETVEICFNETTALQIEESQVQKTEPI